MIDYAYEVTLTNAPVESTSAAVGDRYLLSFQLNDAAVESWRESFGSGMIVFFNAISNVQVSALAGNTGSHVPSWTSLNTSFVASGNGSGTTNFLFNFLISGGSSVYGTGSPSPSALTSMQITFLSEEPFSLAAPGGQTVADLYPSAYTLANPAMVFRYEAGGSRPQMQADIAAVPEPSTWALLGLGATVAGFQLVRRRRVA